MTAVCWRTCIICWCIPTIKEGIAAELLRRIKEHYKDYLYIELMPEERKNVAFYQKHGFQIMEGGTPMLICHAGTGVFQDHAK